MLAWPPKDPHAVLPHTYEIPLDAGDSVASATFEKLEGDVVVDGWDRDAEILTAWLSGGTDGTTSVFRVTWTTAQGRTDDDTIALTILANEPAALALTGYAKPSPQHLRVRYPAFASVDPATIQYWLTDAERSVDASWSEGDYAAALMALAAHNMTSAGLGTDAAALVGIPAGVTRMKSASLELGFSEQAANARLGSGFGATRYGAEYQLLLRRNRGGPMVGLTGAAYFDTYDVRNGAGHPLADWP